MKKILISIESIFLTFFYSGKVPYGPGTSGSIFSFLFFIYLALILKLSIIYIIFITISIIFLSIPIINNYEKRTNSHDNKHIVIDEFAGVFISSTTIIYFTTNYLFLILGLILFRFFDIAKPGIIGKIDKEFKGGIGVMLDDIIAGIFSGIFTIGILFLTNYLGVL